MNRNRRRVGEMVSLLPGIHIRRLARILGLQLSTTRHHLKVLEKEGKIRCLRDGQYLRAYPSAMKENRERETFALLHHRAAKIVLKGFLDGGPRGLTGAEISSSTGLSESTVSECLGMFRELGIVKRIQTEDGRWVVEMRAEDRLRLSAMVSGLESNFLGVVADSYVDLWDF